jgi:hypothetical protein
MADKTIKYIFLLSALGLVLAYFVGAATDTNALAAGVTKLVYAVTLRNPQGQLQNYPSGGGATIQTF